ncbi:phosphatase PAP2 family protein [Lactobacillus corticis]|uniref:Membrane-associated phospholipid phosphatase n=1 Tax=Lactobacillus corticis TaxID=2201249 RepID=A0A916VH28_9LACO|nr:phosphatase PAP2 family protein [Lactobacillus corticis]GFZ26596.1 membrane-associated phospholipid phosphatase [Lactobacillus corticis]
MREQFAHPIKDTLVPGVVFAVIFTVWALLVSSNSAIIHSFDSAVIGVVYNNNATLIQFTSIFTNIGNTSSVIAETVVVFVVLLWRKHKQEAYFLAGTMICANGYNWVLKHLVQRARPTVHHLVHADGYSFPSGHSVGSATLFGCLIIITCILVQRRSIKIILNTIWFIFPLVIGYTRIFLHVHYPSDVLGGWLEGITFVLLGYSVLYHVYYEPRINNARISE